MCDGSYWGYFDGEWAGKEMKKHENMSISEWVKAAHALAVQQGWWDGQIVHNVPEKLALIHSEISEALEEWRNARPNFYTGENSKPEGFGVELADAVIRIFDLAGWMGIDLEMIIEIKHNYNKTRPHRHGGKRC